MEKRSVYIYMEMIYQIGGAETWLYHLTNALKDDFDVKVIYNKADAGQLARLSVPHEKYDFNKIYICDILLNLFTGRPNRIYAGHYIQTVHSNYSQMPWYKFTPWEKTDSYIFASEEARKYFPLSLDGILNVVLENPLSPPKGIRKNRKFLEPLKIMAATRLTEEKGGPRLVKLVKQFHQAKVPVELHLWTNWTEERFHDAYGSSYYGRYFRFHQPELNLMPIMAKFNYVTQLSDCEAYCYTVHEALAVKTPVIVTDWDGVRNAVRDGENGYIYNMNMTGHTPQELLSIPSITKAVGTETSRAWVKYLKELPIYRTYEKPSNWQLR